MKKLAATVERLSLESVRRKPVKKRDPRFFWNEKKASPRTAALKPIDKRVIDSFIDERPMEGKLLLTDGEVLEKIGAGGHVFARWIETEGPRVIEVVSPIAVKSDEAILRVLKKATPAKLLHIPWDKPSPYVGAGTRRTAIGRTHTAGWGSDPIRIYIADLAAYNAGKLVGEWVDLPADPTELEEIMDRLSHGGDHDIAIHDYEAPFRIDEYTSIEELNEAMEEVEMNDVDLDVLTCVHEYGGYSKLRDAIEAAQDTMVVEAKDDTDLAYEYIDQVYGDAIPQELAENYFDYDKFGRDLAYDYPDESEQYSSPAEFAEEFISDMGEIDATTAQNYFDYEKFGRDLSMDYTQCNGFYLLIP
jgi:antirestriction protein